ncbi:MotA/TolQ/ExbB proton channel family protein [Cytophagaceae bacterium ABcell3]|nr:MotA/TolQ/ExbB proton channel family protein [Cytophagaceae bacterium ABcell3]
MNSLLQITTTGSEEILGAAEAAAGSESLTLLDLIMKGGIIMIPLFILSIIAVYIIVERLLNLKKHDKDPDKFMDRIRDLVYRGDTEAALKLCRSFNTPFSRMVEKGITKIGKPLSNIEASIENVGKIEVYRLEKNLSSLATISGAAPMIGFLGTVIGMIQAFISIAQVEGTISPKLLSTGIYQAMITTVAGLAVGIIAYFGYNFLVAKVQKIIHKMEYASIEFIELLQEPK